MFLIRLFSALTESDKTKRKTNNKLEKNEKKLNKT
jgi:hypothetical protein